MSLLRTIKRCTNTAIRLPFAMAWDVLSLGNMGDGASTSKVLREHEARKQLDDATEIGERLGRVAQYARQLNDAAALRSALHPQPQKEQHHDE